MSRWLKRGLSVLLVLIMSGIATPLGELTQQKWSLPSWKGFDWFSMEASAADAVVDGVTYTYTLSGSNATITKATGVSGALVVPGILDGYVVAGIGSSAFMSCTELTSVVLPNSVTAIGGWAFRNCTKLSSINYPPNLTSAGSGIFLDCNSLTSITVPEGVTALPDSVFRDCANFTTINLPNTLKTIGASAFAGCRGLTGTFTIPSGVTSIGYMAFSDCTGLSTIILPNEITTLDRTFYGCTGLTSMVIPDNVTTITSWTFRNCTKLSSVNYPPNLTSAGSGIFLDCTSLTSITVPEGVTALPDSVFRDCANFTAINLPSTLKTIGASAFAGCRGLSGAFTIPSGVTSIGYMAFSDCTGLSTVILPNGITTLDRTFYGCTGLTSIVIPDSVTSITSWTFRNCTKLSSVNYPPNLTSAGSGIFLDCTSLTSITVPEGVTALPDSVFRDCANFTTINLPSSLKTIGSYALAGCKGLSGTYTIPAGVTSIGYMAFQGSTGLSTVILPNGITTLDRTFYGCTGLTSIVIPDGVTSISGWAFRDCTNLSSVLIPATVTSFGSGVFLNCPRLTILSEMASFATIYAIDNSIPYIPTSDHYPDSPLLSLDRSRTRYETNFGAVSSSGYISMILDYAIKESAEASVSNMILTIKLPLNSTLVNSSLTLDGTLITNFTNDNGNVTIPVSKTSGVVRFSVKPTQQGNIVSYAQLSFRKDGTNQKEIIGVVNQNVPLLTLMADDVVASPSTHVSGIAPASSTVTLYVDNALAGSTAASKAGLYSATISLGQVANNKTYQISASAPGVAEAARTSVTYEENAPILTGFKMLYNGTEYNLLDTSAAKPTATFVPNKTFTFTADFINPGAVNDVYIVSDRNNLKKYLPAQWDGAKQQFVAAGYFDPTNPSYVPGIISIEYVKEGKRFSWSDEVDFTSDEYINTVPDAWRNANCEVISNDDTSFVLDFTLADANSTQIRLSYSEEAAPVYLTPETAEQHGYLLISETIPQSTSFLMTQATVPAYEVYGKVVENVTDELLSYKIFDPATDSIISYVLQTSEENAGYLSDVYGIGKSFYSHSGRLNDIGDARSALYASGMSQEEIKKAELNLDLLAVWSSVHTFAKVMSPVISIAFPPAKIPMKIALFASGMLLDCYMLKVKHISANQAGGFSFRWAIDPAGYVYEAVPGNRLEGVKTTAYWKENPTDSPMLWDAEEFNQFNPLYTDHDGRYAWDVPEGLWQVKYELDGYETAYSTDRYGWLPVPPPQLEVNVGMVSKEAPKVAWFNVYEDYAELEFTKYMQPDTLTSLVLKDASGNNVPFDLQPFSEDSSEGVMYAKHIQLVFKGGYQATIGSSYTLSVTAAAKSYAGISAVAETVTTDATKPIQINAPASIIVLFGDTKDVTLTLSNYDPARPVEFTATSDFDEIAEVVNVGSIGADGSVTIKIEGKLLGQTTLTLAIPSTGASIQVPVSVAAEGPETHLLTVNSGTGDGEYEAGTTVTIIANTAPTGQRFKQWNVSPAVTFAGGTNATSATAKFAMPASAVTATATYEPIPETTYAVTVNSGTGGGNFAQGATVTITANAAPTGQQFKQWNVSPAVTFTEGTSATSATAKFTMPAGAVTATAAYEPIPVTTYAVTVNSGTGGGNYAQGATVTIIASNAPTGQRFKQWNVSPAVTFTEGTSATSATAKFAMPAQAVTATATYEPIPPTTYTVTYNTDGGTPATIAPVTAASGTSITLPAAPTKSKNIFKGWKTGNTTLAAGASYTVTGNVTFTAQWAKTIFSTKYEATFLNWILFFVCFGFIWMWF